MHRLIPNRVAGRWKGRRVKRNYRDPADRWVAVPLPINSAAAIRAEMKSNLVAAIGVALVDLPLAVEPHPLFGIGRTELESSASAALAHVAVAKINPITRSEPQWHCPTRSIGLPPGYLSQSNRFLTPWPACL